MVSRGPRLGAAYYPEQWPRERWAVDAALMAEAGLSVVRMAEFSWSRLEPAPGELDFDWLDEAIALMSARGLEVILGTPTAAPPAWLIERHPEILPLRADGRVHPFGHRRHYCPNNPDFHEATRRIVSALGERYGSDDRVTAWQIDNELGGRCICEVCHASFHEWLRDRYGSLENLNESWGTAFWSQTYSSWSQIPLPEGGPVPLPDGFLRASPNPSLALDFRRFVSDSYVRYLQLQIDELRSWAGQGQAITTNLMGFRFAEIDYHALAQPLDAIAWDNYPLLDREGRWSTPALAADTMRGLKDAPVWVLEQQVGPLGWEVVRTPRRGQMRLLSYQAIGHGAELLVYFRWRTARFGTEQHWHGVLDADGRQGRRFQELTELGLELGRLRDVFAESAPASNVAILHDYDSRFALQVQPTNPALAFEDTVQRHYEALRRLGLGIDVINPARSPSPYRVVVAPSLAVLDPALAESLRAYVEAGGLLVLGPHAGVRDRCNVTPERPLPAWLDELAGVERTDIASLLDGRELRVVGVDGIPDGSFRGWAEELQPKGARALALYADGDFAETTAIASHAVGKGRVVYLGGAATIETLLGLYGVLAAEAGLRQLELPLGLEALPLRRNGGDELLLLLNHADEERVVSLEGTRRDLVAETTCDGLMRLAPFGVALLEPVPSAVESA
jgi:beta-galactosidase